MTTIKEVAELAGVSVGTVSHVVTGAISVSEPLRVKVQAAIRKLHYHPNHIARSLKNRRTQTLGFIVPDLTVPFFPQIIRGAEAAARQQNCSVMAMNSGDSGARQKELLSLLHSQRVDGVLLILAAAPTPAAQISRMIAAGIPIVLLDRIPERGKLDSVTGEDRAAAAMGVEHLIARGYRRIAIVTGPLTLRNERSRLSGYKDALRSAGLPAREEHIWQGNLRPEEVARLCRERLLDPACRPDAILTTNAPTGLGALRALRECGLATPADIGFVTFDELVAEDLFEPSITTIVQPAYDIGYRAAGILLGRIGEGEVRGEPISIALPAELKVRDSSRAKPAHRR